MKNAQDHDKTYSHCGREGMFVGLQISLIAMKIVLIFLQFTLILFFGATFLHKKKKKETDFLG